MIVLRVLNKIYGASFFKLTVFRRFSMDLEPGFSESVTHFLADPDSEKKYD